MGGRERATFGKEGGRFSQNICAASGTPPWRGRWSHPSAGPAADPSGVHLNGKSGLQGSLRHTLSPEEGLSCTLLPQPRRSSQSSGTFLQPPCSKCNIGQGVGSTGLTWELARNADSQALPVGEALPRATWLWQLLARRQRQEAGQTLTLREPRQPSPRCQLSSREKGYTPSHHPTAAPRRSPSPHSPHQAGAGSLGCEKMLGWCEAEPLNRSANICAHAERMRGRIQLKFALCRLQINIGSPPGPSAHTTCINTLDSCEANDNSNSTWQVSANPFTNISHPGACSDRPLGKKGRSQRLRPLCSHSLYVIPAHASPPT